MHDASITTDQWLQFVRRHGRSSSPRTGLIAIRDRRGMIHALFSYRIDSDLRVRKRLSISDLIVAHLAGSQIDDAVADVIADVARQYGCQAVTIERPFVTSDMGEAWDARPPRRCAAPAGGSIDTICLDLDQSRNLELLYDPSAMSTSDLGEMS